VLASRTAAQRSYKISQNTQFYTRTNKPYERLAEHLEMTNTVKYQTNKMYKTWYEIGPNVTNKKYYLVELK